MSSAIIHSIMARCILEPAFLQRIMDDPKVTLQEYPLHETACSDLMTTDWERIRHFTGFVTKVQHNYLWEEFPCTRALLKFYNAEIQVFAAYSAQHQQIRAQGQVSRNDKIALFIDFLQQYLRQSETAQYPGLQAMLLHERVQWQLRQALETWADPVIPDAAPPAANFSGSHLDAVTPAVHGLLQIEEYAYDPLAIISLLTQGHFQPEQAQAQRSLGYWADRASLQLRIFELDEVSGRVLTLVNGCRSVRAITRLAARQIAGGIRPCDLRPILGNALQVGLLRANLNYDAL